VLLGIPAPGERSHELLYVIVT